MKAVIVIITTLISMFLQMIITFCAEDYNCLHTEKIEDILRVVLGHGAP